jgi:hypothetical protein
MTAISELEMIDRVFVACFEELPRNSLGGTEKNNKNASHFSRLLG